VQIFKRARCGFRAGPVHAVDGAASMTPQAPADLAQGDPRLDAELADTSYRFKRHLAAGAMGEVAIVEHLGLAEERVMKILRPHLAGEDEIAARLRTEARILTRLQHENLVRVLDFGFTRAGRPFLVTELLRGMTLKDKLGPRGWLGEHDSLDFARQMLRGLEPVHQQGIVHRDLKPDNLFVLDGPSPQRIKILDFGVAKVLSAQDRAALGQHKPTAEGMLVGTPLYVSPEQALGRPVDIRADS
jgi:serine/threonine-protein kinase